MLINKKIVIFQLKQKAKEINMSTQKKNSLNGQKCQFLHKKQKNKIPNQWHMTIIMHVVQIKTYFYLHLLEAKKKNQQQPKKTNTILSRTHIAFNHDQVTQLFHPFWPLL